LILLTRPECGLCEDMLQELEMLRKEHELPPIRIVDVDSDQQLQRRYGLKIPVLLWDRVPVCSVRLDRAELLRMLSGRPGAA
jgi:thiol-disulfide isomerase/thioredoxin